MEQKVSRRTAIKVIGSSALSAALLNSIGCQSLLFQNKNPSSRDNKSTDDFFSGISPVNRSEQPLWTQEFSGDNFNHLAHKYLWNKANWAAQFPAPSEQASVVIVGGGVGGLVSAYMLRDLNPVLLERAPRFGGNSKAEVWEGIEYSLGAAYFMEPPRGSSFMKFLDELRVKEDVYLKDIDWVVEDNTLLEDFWRRPREPSMKTEQIHKLYQHFIDLQREENGWVFPDLQSQDPKVVSFVKKIDPENFQTYLEKIVGGPLHPHIQTLLEHYCWSTSAASMSELSAAAALANYVSEFGKAYVTPGGNANLTEKILRRLSQALPQKNLRNNSLVLNVKVKGDRVFVTYIDDKEKMTTIEAKAVIMAAPKFIAGGILEDLSPQWQQALKKLKYRSYLVANVLINQKVEPNFYETYLLHDGKVDTHLVKSTAERHEVTDLILANFSSPHPSKTVLTLYRGLPYDGARKDLLSPNSFLHLQKQFKNFTEKSLLPLFKISKENVVGLRMTRWGHPMPVATPGLIAQGVPQLLHQPFQNRVAFVGQDNWLQPAFETCFYEADKWTPVVRKWLEESKS